MSILGWGIGIDFCMLFICTTDGNSLHVGDKKGVMVMENIFRIVSSENGGILNVKSFVCGRDLAVFPPKKLCLKSILQKQSVSAKAKPKQVLRNVSRVSTGKFLNQTANFPFV